jgi:hypothetical protein
MSSDQVMTIDDGLFGHVWIPQAHEVGGILDTSAR